MGLVKIGLGRHNLPTLKEVTCQVKSKSVLHPYRHNLPDPQAYIALGKGHVDSILGKNIVQTETDVAFYPLAVGKSNRFNLVSQIEQQRIVPEVHEQKIRRW